MTSGDFFIGQAVFLFFLFYQSIVVEVVVFGESIYVVYQRIIYLQVIASLPIIDLHEK